MLPLCSHTCQISCLDDIEAELLICANFFSITFLIEHKTSKHSSMNLKIYVDDSTLGIGIPNFFNNHRFNFDFNYKYIFLTIF